MSAASGRRAPDEERRRLFRRMEWVFVYGPPLLLFFVGASSSLLLAWLVPVPGLQFRAKWLIGMLLIVGLPVVAYVIRSRWTR